MGKGDVAAQSGKAVAAEVIAQGRPNDNAGPVAETLQQDKGQNQHYPQQAAIPIAEVEKYESQRLGGQGAGQNQGFGPLIAEVAQNQAGKKVDAEHSPGQVGGHLAADPLILQNGNNADQNAQGGNHPQAGPQHQQPVGFGMQGLADGVIPQYPPPAGGVPGPAGHRRRSIAIRQQSHILRAIAEQETEGKEENQVGGSGGQGRHFPTPALNDAVHRRHDEQAAQGGHRRQNGYGQGTAAAKPLIDAGEHSVLKGDAVAQGHHQQIDQGKGPEPADVAGQPIQPEQEQVAGYCQQYRRNQQSPVAEAVNQPAGKGAFQAALGPGQGENQVGLRLADAQGVADGGDKDGETAKENAAGKKGHQRSDSQHPPAVENAGTGARGSSHGKRFYILSARRPEREKGGRNCPPSISRKGSGGNAFYWESSGRPLPSFPRHRESRTVLKRPALCRPTAAGFPLTRE